MSIPSMGNIACLKHLSHGSRTTFSWGDKEPHGTGNLHGTKPTVRLVGMFWNHETGDSFRHSMAKKVSTFGNGLPFLFQQSTPEDS